MPARSRAQTIISFVAPPAGIAPSVLVPRACAAPSGPPSWCRTSFFRRRCRQARAPPTRPSRYDRSRTPPATSGRGQDRRHASRRCRQQQHHAHAFPARVAEVERSLQTLTYQRRGSPRGTRSMITITGLRLREPSGRPRSRSTTAPVSGAFTGSPPAAITTSATPANWNVGTTPPGGANVALFGAGTHTAVGRRRRRPARRPRDDDAHRSRSRPRESSGVALLVDSGGALTLAGGALLTAQQQATVGGAGQGLLTLMGGALALTGTSAERSRHRPDGRQQRHGAGPRTDHGQRHRGRRRRRAPARSSCWASPRALRTAAPTLASWPARRAMRSSMAANG